MTATEKLHQCNADSAEKNDVFLTVKKVVDGDTINVLTSGPESIIESVRLLGIDTPETVHPSIPVMYYGPEATAFVKTAVGKTKVRLSYESTGKTTDRYGRTLAYVNLQDGSVLNETLLSKGLAYSYSTYPHELTKRYESLQAEAIKKRVGLWKKVKFGQLPIWLQKASPRILRKKPISNQKIKASGSHLQTRLHSLNPAY